MREREPRLPYPQAPGFASVEPRPCVGLEREQLNRRASVRI